jgi:hypothetical protein
MTAQPAVADFDVQRGEVGLQNLAEALVLGLHQVDVLVERCWDVHVLRDPGG